MSQDECKNLILRVRERANVRNRTLISETTQQLGAYDTPSVRSSKAKRQLKALCLFMLSGFVLLMPGGCAYKRFARQAVKYEQAEMFREAVDNYILSLQKKKDKNDDARIGLMRSSKRYADELEQKIDDAYATLRDDRVVHYFIELNGLKDKLVACNLDIDVSHKTQGQFEEAKVRHLRLTYTKAQELLDKEQFEEAERLFAEIFKVDKHYERTAEMYDYSRCEPVYRKGRQCFENKLYRSAYHTYGRLLKINPDYKDAIAMQQAALQYAMLTIALQPVKHAAISPLLARQIADRTKQEFVEKANPFLKIVSTDYTQKMLENQRLAMQNNLPFDAGWVIPIRMYLSCDIINSDYTVSKVTKKECKAYLRYVDKVSREEKFKKVHYFECSQKANAFIRFGYEFIRTDNAAIVASDEISRTFSDQVVYARSEYNEGDLFPGDWGSGRKDTIYTDNFRVNTLRRQFSARSALLGKQDFEQSFAIVAAAEMYKKMNAYDPEK